MDVLGWKSIWTNIQIVTFGPVILSAFQDRLSDLLADSFQIEKVKTFRQASAYFTMTAPQRHRRRLRNGRLTGNYISRRVSITMVVQEWIVIYANSLQLRKQTEPFPLCFVQRYSTLPYLNLPPLIYHPTLPYIPHLRRLMIPHALTLPQIMVQTPR